MRIRTVRRKYWQRNLEKCDMHMILIKVDCHGCSQMLCGLSSWLLLVTVRVLWLTAGDSYLIHEVFISPHHWIGHIYSTLCCTTFQHSICFLASEWCNNLHSFTFHTHLIGCILRLDAFNGVTIVDQVCITSRSYFGYFHYCFYFYTTTTTGCLDLA